MKKHQYQVQAGEFPSILFYRISDYEYDSPEEAKQAAFRAAEKAGYDRNKVKVITNAQDKR